jgi:hypothetical protein
MKRVCGWCQKDMGHAPGPEDRETTGICDRCIKGRVLFERRVLQLRKLIATDPAMIQVAIQCWLIVCAYCGGKWKAVWWAIRQNLVEVEQRLPWRNRKVEKAMTEPRAPRIQ